MCSNNWEYIWSESHSQTPGALECSRQGATWVLLTLSPLTGLGEDTVPSVSCHHSWTRCSWFHHLNSPTCSVGKSAVRPTQARTPEKSQTLNTAAVSLTAERTWQPQAGCMRSSLGTPLPEQHLPAWAMQVPRGQGPLSTHIPPPAVFRKCRHYHLEQKCSRNRKS